MDVHHIYNHQLCPPLHCLCVYNPLLCADHAAVSTYEVILPLNPGNVLVFSCNTELLAGSVGGIVGNTSNLCAALARETGAYRYLYSALEHSCTTTSLIPWQPILEDTGWRGTEGSCVWVECLGYEYATSRLVRLVAGLDGWLCTPAGKAERVFR